MQLLAILNCPEKYQHYAATTRTTVLIRCQRTLGISWFLLSYETQKLKNWKEERQWISQLEETYYANT